MSRKTELDTPQLKTILRKVGKTPIDEPEIYSIIKDNGAMSFYDVPKFVLDRAKKKIDDYDSEELALFYRLIKEKVNNLKYDTSKYKSTENTKELENLSYKDRVTLFDLTKRGAEIDMEDKEGMVSVLEEQKELVWSMVNLDKNLLTEWEQGLVEAIAMSQALDIASTALDVDLGN